jgi:hypothetical protein
LAFRKKTYNNKKGFLFCGEGMNETGLAFAKQSRDEEEAWENLGKWTDKQTDKQRMRGKEEEVEEDKHILLGRI